MSLIDMIAQEANELTDFGNSRDHAEGRGMNRVKIQLAPYYHAYYILHEYFDSISEEEQIIVREKLEKLGL